MALIGHWKFNNNLTATVGNDASTQGSYTPVYGTGKFSECIDFTTDPGLGKSPTVTFTMPQNGTIEYWSKHSGWSWNDTTVTPSSVYHVPLCFISGNPHMYIQYEYGTGVHYHLVDQSGREIYYNVTGLVLPDATWYHTALTWGAGGFNVYIDGVCKLSGASMGSCSFDGTSSMTVQIGNAVWSSRYFKGYIDNLKIYNHQKTDYTDRDYEDGVIPNKYVWFW